MAQNEQQPEEAVSRPAAAAAQFAGNFTQTSMYGRALSQRGTQADQPRDPTTGENTPAGTRETAGPAEPDIASTLTLADDPALRRLIGRFDPAEEALRLAEQPPAGEPWGPEPPPSVIERGTWTWAQTEPAEESPVAADDPQPEPPELGEDGPEGPPLDAEDPFLACVELDSADAQQRLQAGQVEPPPIAPPAPGIGPGPV